MKIESLGHVVLRVSDRARSERFYEDVLGLPICARMDDKGLKMTFFTLGNHHDLAISEVDGEAVDGGPGLDHVAFCIGTHPDQLREARDYLDGQGVKTRPVDHEVTQSLYLRDPDGNGIELYVDTSDAWRSNPQVIAQAEPMAL